MKGRDPRSLQSRGEGARPAEEPRALPQEKTYAEEFYYKKQMAGRTPMVVKLVDGEELRGWIEWYDRDCIKLNRLDGPNLLVMKACIRYMHKRADDDETATPETADGGEPGAARRP